MAFTTADLAAIDTAIKTGARLVRFQDRQQEFQNTEEMLKIRSIIQSQLNPTTTVRQVRMFTDSGF